jgi:hypothetical protein
MPSPSFCINKVAGQGPNRVPGGVSRYSKDQFLDSKKCSKSVLVGNYRMSDTVLERGAIDAGNFFPVTMQRQLSSHMVKKLI